MGVNGRMTVRFIHFVNALFYQSFVRLLLVNFLLTPIYYHAAYNAG